MSIKVEACCNSVDDVIAAEKAGCDRVELNSAISLGGLTPSLGSVRLAKQLTKIPIMAMLRPRSGGFCYTDNEFNQMVEDAKAFIAEGIDGLVFGILREDGTIDSEREKALIRVISHESFKLPKRVQIVHHRAIDVTPDWRKSLNTIIELGFDRVLTSGQKPKAIYASDTIAQMVKIGQGKIEILPGGGITIDNAPELIQKTGVNQIHLHNAKAIEDLSCTQGPNGIPFNAKSGEGESSYKITNKDYFKELISKLN